MQISDQDKKERAKSIKLLVAKWLEKRKANQKKALAGLRNPLANPLKP
jgi:hypothetical protein